MSSRKKKKRKQKQRPRPQARKLREGLPDNVTVIDSPREVGKMSEVLMDFLEPYSEFWGNEEQLHKVLSVGIVAWNAALLPPKERDELIQGTLAEVPPEARTDLKTILDEMIRRKETVFASNKRMIINYELTMLPSGPYLHVLSTF